MFYYKGFFDFIKNLVMPTCSYLKCYKGTNLRLLLKYFFFQQTYHHMLSLLKFEVTYKNASIEIFTLFEKNKFY